MTMNSDPVVMLENETVSGAQIKLPDPQVSALPKRRQFSPAYKRRIVRAADACTAPGEVGVLLRREGLYSSHLTLWRRELRTAEESALSAKARGPKPSASKAEAEHPACY